MADVTSPSPCAAHADGKEPITRRRTRLGHPDVSLHVLELFCFSPTSSRLPASPSSCASVGRGGQKANPEPPSQTVLLATPSGGLFKARSLGQASRGRRLVGHLHWPVTGRGAGRPPSGAGPLPPIPSGSLGWREDVFSREEGPRLSLVTRSA